MMNAPACCYLDSPEVTAMTNYPHREPGLSLAYTLCQFSTRLGLYKLKLCHRELEQTQGQLRTGICLSEAANLHSFTVHTNVADYFLAQ